MEWLSTLDEDTRPLAFQLMAELGLHLHGLMSTGDMEKMLLQWLTPVHERDFVDQTPPVGPARFFSDPYYLGEWSSTIYPVWKEDLNYVLDPMRRIEEWALVGAQGTGKCVHPDDPLTLWSGDVVRAGDLIGRGFLLPTLLDGKVVPGKARAEWNREEPTFLITTETGKCIRRNAQHPLWVAPRLSDRAVDTARGLRMKIGPATWTPIGDIRSGDLVAVPDSLPLGNSQSLPEAEVKLLAYLIGDGGLTSRGTVRFTQVPGKQLDEFILCAGALGCDVSRVTPDNPIDYRVTGRGQGRVGTNAVLNLVQHHGLAGLNSREKHVPPAVFCLGRELQSVFLSRLFSTDGWACDRKRGGGEIGYGTSSQRLVEDVRRLLLRFGVHANTYYKPKTDSWVLSIVSHIQVDRFCREIGIYGKEAALERVWGCAKQSLTRPIKPRKSRASNTPWRYRKAPPGTRWEYVESVGPAGTVRTVAVEVHPTHTFLTEFYEHNTTAALAAQTYKLYRVSKLQKPQKYFDLDTVSRIYFGFFSLNEEKAKDVLYEKFLAILNQSPYFRDKFPLRTRRNSLRVSRGLTSGPEEADALSSLELIFPENLRVVSGSLTSHAVSIDLMSGILDEMNWRRKKTIRASEDANSALALYEQVRNRIRGRFITKHQTNPGLLCIISSKRATTDFMDGLVARMRKEPERCHVSDYSLWDAKPDRKFCGKKFAVFIGSSYGQSRILEPDEEAEYDLNQPRDLPPNVLPVPIEFRPDFEASLNTALRDIAGISTVPYQLLFDSDAPIRAAEAPDRHSPFKLDEVPLGLKSGMTLDVWFDHEYATRFDGLTRKPRAFPTAPRYVHVDLSKSGGHGNDATGISMICPSDVRKIVSKTPDGKDAVVIVPLVYVDFTLRLVAPQGDQIDYDKIRQFLVYLRRLGYRIANVSFDQYQSLDSMQLLAKSGFRVSSVSVDRSDQPYLALRKAYIQRRINQYHYMPLLTELRQLIYDQETGSVDHPDVDSGGGQGSKDVADSLCGAFWSMAEAIAAVKPSVKSPTTLDVARFGGVEGATVADPEVGRAAAIFEQLVAMESPDTLAANDFLRKEEITSFNLSGRK